MGFASEFRCQGLTRRNGWEVALFNGEGVAAAEEAKDFRRALRGLWVCKWCPGDRFGLHNRNTLLATAYFNFHGGDGGIVHARIGI